MNREFAHGLKGYLLEYFPHLLRVWGREKWEDFIFSGSVIPLDFFSSVVPGDPLAPESEQQINKVLFHAIVVSPFKQVELVIEHDFPRFHHRLSIQEPEIRVRILIDVTLYCSPSGFLNARPSFNRNTFTTQVARYLHRYIK